MFLATMSFNALAQEDVPPQFPRGADEPYTASELFAPQAPRQIHLSPNGEWIGFVELSNASGRLFIVPSEGGDAILIHDSGETTLLNWRWAENGEQVLLTLGDEDESHIDALTLSRQPDLDFDGRVIFVTSAGERMELTPGVGIRSEVLGTDPWNPDEILVRIAAPPPLTSGVRRVNSRTGASRIIEERSGATDEETEYLVAGGLQLRAASRPTSRGGLNAVIRDSVNEMWLELRRWDWIDGQHSRPISVAGDGRSFFIADSRERDSGALFALRIDDRGGMNYELLAEHSRADLSEVIIHPRAGHAQAAAFDGLRREWVVVDQSIRDAWTALDELAGDGFFSIVSRDGVDRKWIVRIEKPDRPPTWHLYDNRTHRTSPIDSLNTWILVEPALLVETTALEIPARDGLDLPAYLTLPAMFEGEPIAVVLIVHDGPWTRVGPGFLPLHQWLAGRGYGVLSVNYRGSHGFGKAFAAAGHREWSGAIQNDLIDAALWMVDEGIADGDRIVILGEGFGGYSVLTALSATPDFFAGGAAIDPIIDLAALAESLDSERERALFDVRVSPLDDERLLELISPINHVDSIIRPLFLARTREDAQLRADAMMLFRRSLEPRHIPLRTVDLGSAGLASDEARWIAVLADLERFLETTLGTPRPEGGAVDLDRILDR